MPTDYFDIYKLITECEAFNGSLTDSEAASSIADKLEISRVTYRIFSDGESTDSAVIYTAPGAKLGNSYDFSRETSDTKIVTIRIYRSPDARELDGDEKYLFNIFAEAVISGVSVWNLVSSYKEVLYYDTRSGLPNINYFYSTAGKLLASKKATDYIAGFLNIKNCKTINKLFGSDLCDLFIKDYAQEAALLTDPKFNECFAKFGGDNFAFIIHKDNVQRLVDFLTNADITINYKEDVLEYNMSARIGLARIDNTMTSPHQVLTPATSAFALARRDALPDVLYYSDYTNSILNDQVNYADEINKALDEDKFLIYFQPVVRNNGNGTITMIGAEALIRWRRENEMVNPISFIPVAEKHNFISKLDLYVLNKTCRMIRSWIDQGLTPVPISCNFSKSDLLISNLPERISEILDEHGLDHSLIGIEFTEAGFHEEYEAICYASNDMRKHGIGVIVDNFGSGFSSLQLLQNLDFNCLKIDSSFVNSTDPKSEYILANIIDLTKKLGIVTVCEGVTSEEGVQRAMKFGCDLFQTQLYEKALSERYFVNRLKNNTWSI